jgi:ribosomal protein L24E
MYMLIVRADGSICQAENSPTESLWKQHEVPSRSQWRHKHEGCFDDDVMSLQSCRKRKMMIPSSIKIQKRRYKELFI